MLAKPETVCARRPSGPARTRKPELKPYSRRYPDAVRGLPVTVPIDFDPIKDLVTSAMKGLPLRADHRYSISRIAQVRACLFHTRRSGGTGRFSTTMQTAVGSFFVMF